MIGIYKITSPSKKIYIGQSINISKRFLSYKYKLAIEQPKLNRSFIKYGFSNHTFEIIEECEIHELNDKERYYQELYNCIGNNGLNLCYVKSSDRNGIQSEETRNKISRNSKKPRLGYKLTDKEKENLRIKNMGKKLSEETKKKISLSNKGKKVIIKETTKEKLRILNTGKKASEETKLKMSNSQKNISKEIKNKRIKGLINFYKNNPNIRKGKKHSLETKLKMSNSKSNLVIVDLTTGVFFFSITECAIAYNFVNSTLYRQLKNKTKNKTNLKIV